MQKFVLCFLILILATAEVCSGQTKVIDSLQRFIEKHSRDTNEIRALDHLGSEFMRKDMNKAKFYVYQQIALAKDLQTDFGLAAAYSGLVAIHQNEGTIDSAQYYLTLLEILAKNPANKKAAVNYANSAGLFYKNQGNIKDALPYLLEALRLLQNGDKTARAGQTLNVGNAYYNLGDLKNAADYHLKALVLFEEVKNKRGQSFCFNSLGNDYLDLKQYETAEKYFFQSEKLKEELGDKRGVLTSWMSLGVVYQQTNKADLSMLYFNKALERARELKLSLEESRLLFNMGSLLKQTKKNEEAAKKFSGALVLARQSGDSALVSRIKTYFISMQNEAQKEVKEEQTLLQNIKISLESGALDNTAEGHFELAKWYESRKQFDKAFENLKLAQQLTDSIKGSQVIFQLKRLEEQYNTDKKEKEIALLKKDQELQTVTLSRQRVIITLGIIAFISALIIAGLLINRFRVMNRSKRLLEIEKVRNNIARDLHDDMGSALSSINILSQVALVEKNGNTQSYLQRIGDQSARMMEDMGDMVWSINPRNDSMSQVLIRMREFASEIFELKNIEYQFTDNGKEHFTLNAEQRKNLFLIYKETINNAAKYSQADKIEINLRQQDHFLVMSIKDNGQGFDEQKIKAGNGLRNLRERAKEISATFELKSTVGAGTEVNLKVPLA
ncbi:MAG: tetratricopeptide repeat protein [Cyclobacteriaceae bacterium]|nr:tetratricopeptide repeat protein [Cyclobacteriaceae bacterium]